MCVCVRVCIMQCVCVCVRVGATTPTATRSVVVFEMSMTLSQVFNSTNVTLGLINTRDTHNYKRVNELHIIATNASYATI